MNASELEHLWQRQQPIELSPENIARIAATVGAVDRKFRWRIFWRDVLEVGTAIGLAIAFGVTGRSGLRWVSIAAVLFIAAYILKSRFGRTRRRSKPLCVVDQLEEMIRETDTQTRLLRSLLWWYLLPCGVGFAAIAWDLQPPNPDVSRLLIHGAVFVALGAAVYYLNQRAVCRALEPRRAHLQRALDEFRQRL